MGKVYSRSPGPPFLHSILVILWYLKYHSLSDETPRLTTNYGFKFFVGLASQNNYHYVLSVNNNFRGPGERE